MKVYLNEVNGIASAIASMYMSKRTWTREKEIEIYSLVNMFYNNGHVQPTQVWSHSDRYNELTDYLDRLFRWGTKHITLLKYIGLSFTIEGIHRGAQDDLDSHAKRFDNRIVRASTRLAKFGTEMSDWYHGKILPTDKALDILGIVTPDSFQHNGVTYVKTVHGYVREDLKTNKDVLRGLYMLSIPSTLTFSINLAEFAHIVKLRDKNSHAAPELQNAIEEMIRLVHNELPHVDRQLLYDIEN